MNFDVVIMPSFAEVEAWRKQAAHDREQGLFAQTVTTFDAWIADLWELYGDGRAIVDGVRREVMLGELCGQSGGALATPGVASMASACMREAAGLEEFERAVAAASRGEGCPALSEGEMAFLELLARYERLLEATGFIEMGHAAAFLSSGRAGTFPHPISVLLSAEVAATSIAARFFSRVPSAHVTVDHECDGVAAVPAGLSVRFALPAGELAQPAVIADIACEYARKGDIVVACKDPLKMHGQVERRLVDAGMRVAVQASKPFSRTDFGRAYLAMCHCLHDDPFDPAMLADALLSPYSGFTRVQAIEADKRLRADRLAQREAVFSELRALSDRFSQLEELASDPDADVLIGVFEHVAQSSPGYGSAWRAEQLAALGALKGAMAAARGVHAGIGVCARVLEAASIHVSFSSGGSGPLVVFTSQDGASRMGRGSCATLVVADFTTENYPVSERGDAASTLLGKLGLTPGETALTKARRTMAKLLRVPTRTIVFARPLGNAAADETYPAAALEEFISTYEAGNPAIEPDGGDTVSGDAASLFSRGEEDLYANACALPAGSAQAARETLSQPIDELGESAVQACAPIRRDSNGIVLDKPCPSPSQIEQYLACPFQWYVNSKVKVAELDEGFGPLERGTFAHAALESFYRRFQSAGYRKVNEGNIEEARTVMRTVLDELVQAQFDDAHAGGNRLVPRDELERREVDALCRQLVGYLDFEARLLPSFSPMHFEYAIDADHPADYAGAYLVGKVDRIDVDDEGHAVIIDYKGSVNAGHAIAGKDAADAGKVQTRIYAQVVKRILGLDVVGALYVTYGRNPVVSGAYDARVLDAVHLPNVKPRKCGCSAGAESFDVSSEEFSFTGLSFPQVLDATEELAAHAIEGMCAGAIAPNPTSGACTYCPALCCPKRGA